MPNINDKPKQGIDDVRMNLFSEIINLGQEWPQGLWMISIPDLSEIHIVLFNLVTNSAGNVPEFAWLVSTISARFSHPTSVFLFFLLADILDNVIGEIEHPGHLKSQSF